MTLYAPLLPDGVQVAEHVGQVGDREERFQLGRALVRELLRDPAIEIPRGERGAPRWPDGVVGSITHTTGYAAVALAIDGRLASIGIDAEPLAGLPPEAVEVVTGHAEQADLSRVAGDHAALLAFVAKEAIFKAWWPLTGRELDFAEVELSAGLGSAGQSGGVLSAIRHHGPADLARETRSSQDIRSLANYEFLSPGEKGQRQPGGGWQVRWRAEEGLMLAAVVVPALR